MFWNELWDLGFLEDSEQARAFFYTYSPRTVGIG